MTFPQLRASDVESALSVIAPRLAPTRLLEWPLPGGRSLRLKLECEQPTGSFKVRGAVSNLARLPESPEGFVAASAGNHGLGVAWAARACERRERVTLFVPESAPARKIEKLRAFDIDLRVGGALFDDAERFAHEFERQTGARFIHAYDDVLTAAGQGTVAPEVDRALGPVGTFVVPVGGGGLLTGIAAWVKERRPETRIVAVQPEASPALRESIKRGVPLLEFEAGPTLADGLAGGIGRLVFEHRRLIDETVVVPEALIHRAIRDLHRAGVRAEASGAITLAAAILEEARTWPSPIVGVVTGSNIDDAALDRVLRETEG